MHRSRVLVVDDDEWLRSLLAMWLADEGYDTVEAGNGADAVEQIHSQHPDLVVLDVNLPRHSGLTVLKQLANDEPTSDVPVILMSGSVDLTEARQGQHAEAALNKPFDLEELLAHIRTILAAREQASAWAHCPGCQCHGTA